MTHPLRINPNKKRLFCIGLLLFSLLSCRQGEIYYSFQHIPRAKWFKDSTLTFSMDSLDFEPQQQYDLFVEVVTNTAYPYQNLWLYVEQNFTDSILHRDSLQFAITDAFGKPNGNGVGGLRQLSVPYKVVVFRDSVYSYQMTIRHGMTDKPLIGVEKVGVKIQGK